MANRLIITFLAGQEVRLQGIPREIIELCDYYDARREAYYRTKSGFLLETEYRVVVECSKKARRKLRRKLTRRFGRCFVFET